MPTTTDPLTDDRFDELVAQLRGAPPRASDELRGRVLAAASEPLPSRRGAGLRRVLAPALALALTVAGVAVGVGSLERPLVRDGEEPALVSPGVSRVDSRTRALRPAPAADAEAAAEAPAAAPSPSPFAPAPAGRLQEQRIELGVRVADVEALADATTRATATARSLGGYVVAAHYAVPSVEAGDSTLVLRVPSARVQEALARLTALGSLVSQDVRLQDLQPAYDRRAQELGRLRQRIAGLEQRLAGELEAHERVRVQAELAAVRRAVQAREAQQRDAEQQGRLARIELTLTSRDAAAAPDARPPGPVREALDVLWQLLVWLLAVLIVTGPFLALALLVVLAGRGRRRRLDAALLERA